VAARSASSASRTSASGPITCVPNCRCNSASLCCEISPADTKPALLTSTSSEPKRSRQRAIRPRALPGRAMSVWSIATKPYSRSMRAAVSASASRLRPTAYTA
jgi:hypothetical protein